MKYQCCFICFIKDINIYIYICVTQPQWVESKIALETKRPIHKWQRRRTATAPPRCKCNVIPGSMMTSSNGNIFRVTGSLCGEFTGPGEFPAQGPVTQSFDVFVDLRLNKRLSKQPWGWWFETPSWSLWRHYDVKWHHVLVRGDALIFHRWYSWIHEPIKTTGNITSIVRP